MFLISLHASIASFPIYSRLPSSVFSLSIADPPQQRDQPVQLLPPIDPPQANPYPSLQSPRAPSLVLHLSSPPTPSRGERVSHLSSHGLNLFSPSPDASSRTYTYGRHPPSPKGAFLCGQPSVDRPSALLHSSPSTPLSPPRYSPAVSTTSILGFDPPPAGTPLVLITRRA